MPGRRWYPHAPVVVALAALAAALAAVLGPGTATAQTPPGIPSGVVVTAGDASASVSWVAPDDGGAAVSGYTVTANPGGATASVPGVARSATVTGLTNGTTYRFTVVATNRVGASAPSAVSNAVTPAPAAVAAPPGPRLIDEDFAGTAVDFVPIAGAWAVASGRYTLSAPDDEGESVPNANLAVHATVVTGDFTLSASAASTPTDSRFNDFSVVFGYQDPANYYFAGFSEGNDANTSGVFAVVDGVRTELADITTPIVAGEMYPVRVEREGAAIRVFRAGEQVASVSDPTFPSGRVGFGSRNDGGTFDDLVVTGPAPPPPPPEPPPGFFARLWAWIGSLFSDAPSPAGA